VNWSILDSFLVVFPPTKEKDFLYTFHPINRTGFRDAAHPMMAGRSPRLPRCSRARRIA
jgi:hypothetical protein